MTAFLSGVPATADPADDLFATGPLMARAPKAHFPSDEHDPREIYQLVRDELLLDGVARMKPRHVLHDLGRTGSAAADG